MWQVYPKSSHSFTKCADLSQKFALFAQSHIPCKLMQRFISTEEILLCLLYKTFSTMMENFENFYKLSPIHSNRSNGHGLSVRQWQDLVWHFYWPEKLNFSVKCVLIHDISHSEKSYNILPCQKFKLLTLTNSFKSNEYTRFFQPFLSKRSFSFLIFFRIFGLPFAWHDRRDTPGDMSDNPDVPTLSGSRTFPLANSEPILARPEAFLAPRLLLATLRTGKLRETTGGMFLWQLLRGAWRVTCHEEWRYDTL